MPRLKAGIEVHPLLFAARAGVFPRNTGSFARSMNRSNVSHIRPADGAKIDDPFRVFRAKRKAAPCRDRAVGCLRLSTAQK